MKRDGLLSPGHSLVWRWTRDDITVAQVAIQVERDRVVLRYQQSWRNGALQACSNTVFLDWTPCNFGGQRAWWRCPAIDCGRRVAVLYRGKGEYACRHCSELAYQSQRETQEKLAARRANRVRKKLGWPPGILQLQGGRPKGMHWITYVRLLQAHTEHSNKALAGLAKQCSAMENQLKQLLDMRYSL